MDITCTRFAILITILVLASSTGLAQQFDLNFDDNVFTQIISVIVDDSLAIITECPVDLTEANEGLKLSCAYTELVGLERIRGIIDRALTRHSLSMRLEVGQPWTEGEDFIMKGLNYRGLVDGSSSPSLLIVVFEDSPRGNHLIVFLWEGQGESLSPPTPSPTPKATPTPRAPAPRACCRYCRTGKPCGDSCISRQSTCRKGPGCACQGNQAPESWEQYGDTGSEFMYVTATDFAEHNAELVVSLQNGCDEGYHRGQHGRLSANFTS